MNYDFEIPSNLFDDGSTYMIDNDNMMKDIIKEWKINDFDLVKDDIFTDRLERTYEYLHRKKYNQNKNTTSSKPKKVDREPEKRKEMMDGDDVSPILAEMINEQ